MLRRGSPQYKLPDRGQYKDCQGTRHPLSGSVRRCGPPSTTADVHTHERWTYTRRGRTCRRGAVFGRATRLNRVPAGEYTEV